MAGISAVGILAVGGWVTAAWMVCCGLSAAARAEDAATAFREACARKAADGDSLAVDGGDGWLFLRAELRHLGVGPFWGEAAAKVSRASAADKADPLPAIVDFAGQLERLGIGLLVVPVPCKAAIYPEARRRGPRVLRPAAGEGGRRSRPHRRLPGGAGEAGRSRGLLQNRFALVAGRL